MIIFIPTPVKCYNTFHPMDTRILIHFPNNLEETIVNVNSVTCHIVSHPRAPPFISKFISNFISNATNSYCPTTAALDRVSFVRLCATKAPHFWGSVPF